MGYPTLSGRQLLLLVYFIRLPSRLPELIWKPLYLFIALLLRCFQNTQLSLILSSWRAVQWVKSEINRQQRR